MGRLLWSVGLALVALGAAPVSAPAEQLLVVTSASTPREKVDRLLELGRREASDPAKETDDAATIVRRDGLVVVLAEEATWLNRRRALLRALTEVRVALNGDWKVPASKLSGESRAFFTRGLDLFSNGRGAKASSHPDLQLGFQVAQLVTLKDGPRRLELPVRPYFSRAERDQILAPVAPAEDDPQDPAFDPDFTLVPTQLTVHFGPGPQSAAERAQAAAVAFEEMAALVEATDREISASADAIGDSLLAREREFFGDVHWDERFRFQDLPADTRLQVLTNLELNPPAGWDESSDFGRFLATSTTEQVRSVIYVVIVLPATTTHSQLTLNFKVPLPNRGGSSRGPAAPGPLP